MSGYVFPTSAYNADDSVLLPIPKADIPFFRRLWEVLQDRSTWYSREDWFRGYQEAAWLEEMLMTNSLAGITEGLERIYRLLDTSLNGTAYTQTTVEGVTSINPAIPAVPPTGTNAANAMRAHLGRLHQLAENAATGAAYAADSGIAGSVELDYEGSWRARFAALQGQINAGWFGIGGENATIADIVNALRVGSDDEKSNILQILQDILGAGANAASIFQFVESLFADTANTIGEGAILGTLIASSMANVAALGAMAGQIDRLVAALDGGGLVAATPPPANSVLGELDAIKVQLQ